jgi:hypothetical protein
MRVAGGRTADGEEPEAGEYRLQGRRADRLVVVVKLL